MNKNLCREERKDLGDMGAGGLHGIEAPRESVLLLTYVDGAIEGERRPIPHHHP